VFERLNSSSSSSKGNPEKPASMDEDTNDGYDDETQEDEKKEGEVAGFKLKIVADGKDVVTNGKEPKVIGRTEIGSYADKLHPEFKNTVSRQHIEIIYSPERNCFTMKNLSKAKNSTQVGEKVVEPGGQIDLVHKCIIVISDVQIMFIICRNNHAGIPAVSTADSTTMTTTNASNTSKETRSSTPITENSLQQALLQSKLLLMLRIFSRGKRQNLKMNVNYNWD